MPYVYLRNTKSPILINYKINKNKKPIIYLLKKKSPHRFKSRLKENLIRFQIRFQLWVNFVPCVYLNFSIFVPSKLMSVKY